ERNLAILFPWESIQTPPSCDKWRADRSSRHPDQRPSYPACLQIKQRVVHLFEPVLPRDESRQGQLPFREPAGVARDVAVRHGLAAPGADDPLAADEVEGVEGDLLTLREVAREDAQPPLVPDAAEGGLHGFSPPHGLHRVIDSPPPGEFPDGRQRIALAG